MCINTGYINSTRGTSSIFLEDVHVVEFMYPVFTHMPGKSHCRQVRSLYLCYVFTALINFCSLLENHKYLSVIDLFHTPDT